jgi:hypothetical protein
VVIRAKSNAVLDSHVEEKQANKGKEMRKVLVEHNRLSCWRRDLVWHLGLDLGQLLIPLVSEFPLSL